MCKGLFTYYVSQIWGFSDPLPPLVSNRQYFQNPSPPSAADVISEQPLIPIGYHFVILQVENSLGKITINCKKKNGIECGAGEISEEAFCATLTLTMSGRHSQRIYAVSHTYLEDRPCHRDSNRNKDGQPVTELFQQKKR